MKSEPRIAFVIDALPSLGGGEKVLFTALEAFPNAELFTLVYNKTAFTSSPISNHNIKTSFIDRIPLAHHPWGFEIMLGVQLACSAGLVTWLKARKLW